MRVLLLSPYPELVAHTIQSFGDTVTVSTAPPAELDLSVDKIVSFGYRHILKGDILRRQIINIHISLLPWNRGADPNFWSFYEDTPKGVSIHVMDEGIDTGPLIAQRELSFFDGDTLYSSYNRLKIQAEVLFHAHWAAIREDRITPKPQPPGGSFHRSKDKQEIWSRLPDRFHTPVSIIQQLGTVDRAVKAIETTRR